VQEKGERAKGERQNEEKRHSGRMKWRVGSKREGDREDRKRREIVEGRRGEGRGRFFLCWQREGA